jgi:hypothetical protein
MPLAAGTRLGPYEIVAPIGAGGMGEKVYRARDAKLNRDVALKILPDAFASDPDRLARFTREAQTLASLNHPNIAHIHGLEESGGVRAIVTELVEGDTLEEELQPYPRKKFSPSRSRSRTHSKRHTSRGSSEPVPGRHAGRAVGQRGRKSGRVGLRRAAGRHDAPDVRRSGVSTPTLGPHGHYVVFSSIGYGIFQARADAASQPQALTQNKNIQFSSSTRSPLSVGRPDHGRELHR